MLLCALGAVALLLAVPAFATANAPIVVNTTTDSLPPEGGESCTGLDECTLRDAINKANAETGPDTITFTPIPAGEPLAVEDSQLPSIYEQVTIEGDSAEGATAGVPALALEPVYLPFGPFGVPGISVLYGEGTRIEGLAIGGFGFGIELGVEETGGPVRTEICGDYIGTEIKGEVAVPNETGVEIRNGESGYESPQETIVGNGTTCAGNVISGNKFYGVDDSGVKTTIAGNSIGIGSQPSGDQLPNGTAGDESAGILEGSEATEAKIGGTAPSGDEGNLIYFNHGPGVLVEKTSSEVSIRHNYFFKNEGLGIEVPDGEQPAPTITEARSPGAGKLKVTGFVTGAQFGEDVELEFYGSPSCDVSGKGEGQTYLGSFEWFIFGAGRNEYSETLFVEPPADDTVITAISTREAGATTEFSTCATYVPPAGPQTFTVTTTEDVSHGECTVTVCSLRDAIEAANESDAEDTIEFATGAEGVIELDEDLPVITEPVEIDGTSAPGYAGKPLVMLDGSEIELGGEGPASEGLRIRDEGGGSVIKGLALGGFESGVWLDGSTGSRLCSSWIGVALDGTTAMPNLTGVEIGQIVEAPSENSLEDEVGVGCGEAPANVIAGNSIWGVRDVGMNTEIGGNVIGVSPGGTPMPNGEVEVSGAVIGGGLLIQTGAGEPQVGGIGGAIPPNTIAYNEGPGVFVESRFSRPRIRANSIYGNAGKGILYEEEAPIVPTISSVTGQSGSLAVAGQVTPGDDDQVELDFFASAICSPLSAGVGETYLGSETLEVTPVTPKNYEKALTTPIGDDELYITVTATGTGTGTTTEFSECVKRPEPKHEETKPGGGTTETAKPQPHLFIPKNGEKVVVKPEEGKVKIKLPGTKKYVVLTELKEIPVGAVIDATNGRVKLTSISPDGTEQTAEFFGGVFRVKQKEGSGLVVLELLDTTACPAPKKKSGKKKNKGTSPRAFASSVSFRPKSKSPSAGKLWGSGHGNFRTEGHDGSATVEGTIWLVEDRCNGTTFFRTRRGIVKVRDFVKHKSLPLPAGKTYLAGEE